MKKEIALVLMAIGAILFPGAVHAQWRTAGEAREVINESVAVRHALARKAQSAKLTDKATLAYTMQADGHNTVYVFDIGSASGSVFVGGYEGIDVLGYTEKGNFCIDSIPPALADILNCYSGVVNMAANDSTGEILEDMKRQKSALAAAGTKEIDHLVQTHWSQFEPYNWQTPDSCPTGCTATMMAQILKYYNYPAKGKGTFSYDWNGTTLSANFGATTYDWNHMLENYGDGIYSKEQGNAVATLMYHAGVSASMNYTSTGSGASFKHAIDGFVNHFDYSYACNIKHAKDFPDFETLIYSQLEQGHPVPFAGDDGTDYNGHAYIIDGYKDGLFGVNIGWGGASDGYFSLAGMRYFGNQYGIFDLYPNGSYVCDKEGEDGEFTVTRPGTLKSLLAGKKYRSLTLHGKLNGEDLRELRSRCACTDYGYYPTVQGLKELDLQDVTLVSGGVYCQSLSTGGNIESNVAKADTVGFHAIGSYGMTLERLLLPRNATTLEWTSLRGSGSSFYLRLPDSLKTYTDNAIWWYNASDFRIEVPEDCKFHMDGSALYSPEWDKLCLLRGTYSKYCVNPNCHELLGASVSTPLCSVDTLIVPGARKADDKSYFSAKVIWLGDKTTTVNQSYVDTESGITLYLPSRTMVTLEGAENDLSKFGVIYVPEELLAQYRTDANWKYYSSLFKSIESSGLVLDSRHILPIDDVSLMRYGQKELVLSILDTHLLSLPVTWESSNPNIACVSSEGVVTATGAGSATITVHVGEYSQKCTVTVQAWPEIHVSKPGTLASLVGSDTYQYLKVTGNINGDDVRVLRQMCGAMDYSNTEDWQAISDNPALEYLDLKDCNLTAGGVYGSFFDTSCTLQKNIVPKFMFSRSMLKYLSLPASATGFDNNEIISRIDNLQTLELPENITTISTNVVYLDKSLEKIIFRGRKYIAGSTSFISDTFKYIPSAKLYVYADLLGQFRADKIYGSLNGVEPLESMGITVSIDEVHENTGVGHVTPEGIYTLGGQRVSTAGHGIYIINGQKVMK